MELWKLVLYSVGSYFLDFATFYLHFKSIALSLAYFIFSFYSFYALALFLDYS
jgi:hypothetical protein